MKKTILILLLFGVCKANAMNDLERAVLFIANSASGGTYLPGMEAEKEKILLVQNMQTASLRAQAEAAYQQNLRHILQQEIDRLEKLNTEASEVGNSLKERAPSLLMIGDLLSDVYNARLTLEQMQLQLFDQGKVLKALPGEWHDLVNERMLSDTPTITREDLHAIVLAVIDRQVSNQVALESIEKILRSNQDKIDAFKKKLQELK